MCSQMMGLWQPVTNLREYVSNNPPVVTFFFCLLSLAISFICLSSYSHTHTLPNPDIAKDWNQLLSSLSQFQLCVKPAGDSSELISSNPTLLMEQEHKRETLVKPSAIPSLLTHLQLIVPLSVTSRSASASVKDLALYITLRASQLQLGGNEIVNVTLDFLSGNSNYTCLTISAPTHILPLSPLPPKCPAFEKNVSPVHVEVSSQLPSTSQSCYSLQSKNEPTLTVMLTQGERSVAVRHLLEVSVFLLGVCLILCLAASVTHSLTRYYHWTGLDLKNDPLIDT